MHKSDQHEGECVEIIPPPQEQKLSGLARELQSLELCLYLVSLLFHILIRNLV